MEGCADTLEQSYNEILVKKNVTYKGFKLIETNFTDVDQKREDHVKDCFHKVNKFFGEIFSQLLPGANAQMK